MNAFMKNERGGLLAAAAVHAMSNATEVANFSGSPSKASMTTAASRNAAATHQPIRPRLTVETDELFVDEDSVG